MDPIDIFISRLYRATPQIELAHFRYWALNELQNLIDFDTAIWSTGHLSTRTFHTHTLLGLPESYPEALLKALPVNPISKQLFTRAGSPVDMAEVISDGDFYRSEVYLQLFKPHGIERILSSIHIDSRSGIYTLLSLYRGDRTHGFETNEKQLYQRALYHLLNAASQACLLGLNISTRQKMVLTAICDKHGVYHEVEPGFLDLIEESFPANTSQLLPFSIPEAKQKAIVNTLCITATQLGDLYRVAIRHSTPLDQLTAREQEVVEGVTQGLSFKHIAKKLGLSPSTVSNHLYRVYQKLNIGNRAELADMIQR